jgi:hypothetical protein
MIVPVFMVYQPLHVDASQIPVSNLGQTLDLSDSYLHFCNLSQSGTSNPILAVA